MFVEDSYLGKGEVGSSILPSSTSFQRLMSLNFPRNP